MNKLKKEGIIDIPKRGKLIIIDFNKLLTNTFNTDI
jgi:hypothetical protein